VVKRRKIGSNKAGNELYEKRQGESKDKERTKKKTAEKSQKHELTGNGQSGWFTNKFRKSQIHIFV
jgi:hypothetical protein